MRIRRLSWLSPAKAVAVKHHPGPTAPGGNRAHIGQVIYRGHSVNELSREQRRAYLRDIQPIFQDPFESYNPFYKGRSCAHHASGEIRPG